MSPRFSIVIPTRERKATLGPCIAGCLRQDHANFEIVVQDNASLDGTQQLATSHTDPRVKYFRSPNRVSMRANFEAGVRNARGDYIIVIGDDDGIVPLALRRLDALVSRGDVDFISWPTLYYYWPGADPNGVYRGLALKRNGVFGPYQNVPPDKLKTSLARGRPAHFRYVPKIYHGCVSRRLIERLRNGNGDVFRYDIPDVYFQVAATVVGAKGITSRHPATIWGGSAASTGGGQFGNTSGKLDTSADTAFGRFVQEAGSDPTATVPFNPCFASTDYYSYASLLVAAQAYGLQTPVDHDAWAARVVRQLSLNPSHWKIAQQATAMSPLDERIISALGNLGRTPKAEAAPTSVVKQRSSRKLSRCNLETQIDGADTVCTATQILETSFGSRHRDFPAVPGWQVVQLLRWTQLLAASRGIITA